MQFIYSSDAKNDILVVDGDLYKYIFKVRRASKDSELYFRNLEDKNIYKYKIVELDRRKATLQLVDSFEKVIESHKSLHIGWCVIDPKSIEKNIASLNELGVSKITFFYCDYSQKNYKINYEKLNKLLINSSMQCGRSSIIQLDEMKSLEEFLDSYPDSFMFNFSSNHIFTKKDTINSIVIGCEGGFSKEEIKLFDPKNIVGIDSNLILRSETAVDVVATYINT